MSTGSPEAAANVLNFTTWAIELGNRLEFKPAWGVQGPVV